MDFFETQCSYVVTFGETKCIKISLNELIFLSNLDLCRIALYSSHKVQDILVYWREGIDDRRHQKLVRLVHLFAR